MADRIPISKKLRFEVFKRDSFTCQYCGRRAPDVVLHCDHVKPVAGGGTADILNLITACFDCNSGKGARELSDDAVLRAQVDQLADLQERREQIDMMLNWREELQNLSEDTIERVVAAISSRSQFTPNENGKADIRRWLKRHTVDEILQAADDAFAAYLAWEKNQPTADSWNVAFKKIPAFLSIQRQEVEKPYIRRLIYIQGIIRNRTRMRRYDCVDYLEHLHLHGKSLDELETLAKKLRKLEDFEAPLDAWLTEIGKPF